MVMTRAKTAAWNFYMARINEMVERQLGSFQLDQPAPCLILSVPSKECVAVIESACRDAANEARNEAYGKALGPLVRAIDAIDNSPAKAKKSPEIRELYADLTGCYDALHKLWAEAKAADAVDPHVTDTGKPSTRPERDEGVRR